MSSTCKLLPLLQRILPATALATLSACAASEIPTTTATAPESSSPVELIVGGEVAPDGAYPWMVGLLRAHQPDNYQAQFCGGTLINSRYVLTAAHCLLNTLNPGEALPQNIEILIGTHDLSSGGTRIDVVNVLLHPDYNPVTSDSDIALLELAEPADFDFLDVAGLSDGSFAGDTARAIGWGNTRYPRFGTSYPEELHQVDVTVVANDACDDAYRQLTDNMICAGDPGQDACQGDSGGPLVVREGLGWKQVGITSFGVGCGRPRYPGVYTRVSEFEAWIAANSSS